MRPLAATALLALAALPLPALAQEEQPAEGTAAAAATDEAMADASQSRGATGALVNAEGAEIGNVSISFLPSGIALVTANAEGVPEGVHGWHVHAVGACEGPGFESAGPHIAGDRQHGVASEEGPHPGDLPNVTVQSDGVLAADGFAVGLTMDMVFDGDGTAVVLHAEPDDYTTQPGGASGARIACAVIQTPPNPEEGQSGG